MTRHQHPISLLGGLLIGLLGVHIFRQKPESRQQESSRIKLPLCFVSSFAIAVTSPATVLSFLDWQSCDALVVTSKPSQGYASISTVNLGFISQAGGGLNRLLEQNDVRVLAALYAPLDGMNEKGLAVSVNMIQDGASIGQNTDKPDLTTTTAVQLLAYLDMMNSSFSSL